MDILAQLIDYLIGKCIHKFVQIWSHFSVSEEVIQLCDEPSTVPGLTMPYAPAERKRRQRIGEIWRRYKVWSLTVMAMLGGLFPGLGGVFGWIIGTNTNQINQTETMLVNSSGEAAVVSITLGMLFGFLFGCYAVWHWLREGGQEAWAVWIDRFLIVNILTAAGFFLAFRLLVL